ncbi:DMSO/Nitrate reductase chaperone [Moorella glycerini]|uniref:Tat proofreading chaperone DmsD n=1 Tax=Neomoorella stamsii TaxID=1266720 RepID=A0A9X7J2R4_9FIRM|nr:MULTISPECIES: molecular chaperone TorD family protein [Moorella]PRR72731.1 Tat proofreading chaperone DmsD [Moorella stamsii]CEP68076.1 DMSO/Nitrate reductase chaperone [Moorella glycerini]
MDKELLLEWLQGRELIYRFLARLYQEGPGKELLSALVEEQLLVELPASIDNPMLATGCRQMQAELTARAGDMEAYQQELQEDYNRLFVGPGHLEAPPWESVYRSKEHLLFGEETLAVREFYRSFGLESKKKNREPDDHLGLEMEFMAWLSRTAAAKVQAGEEATEFLQGQQRFLKEHLEQWVPALCSDIQKAARTEFFRGLALFTRGWLQVDAAELEAVLEDFCGGEKS